jgi:Putative threonine efflux protein
MSVFALFALTVLPLIFTPGPDMLFILSQVMGKDAKAGMMATIGICSGYLVHSILVALGIAALSCLFRYCLKRFAGWVLLICSIWLVAC